MKAKRLEVQIKEEVWRFRLRVSRNVIAVSGLSLFATS